jgi:hypothetical protein
MTRRIIIGLLLSPLAAQPDTPRNRLSNAGNVFNTAYARWADEMNRNVGTVNATAVRAWEPLPEMWRRVERLWKAWLQA